MLPKILIGIVVLVGLFFLAGLLFRPFQSIGAPSCPDPLVLETPVDIDKVTGMLYPGQERGGHFKYHGGFRFDNSKYNEIEVRVPMDAVITDASRYIENGAVQYMFDFQNDCGIRYRFDHLVELSPKLAEVARELPEPKVDDSRTTRIKKSTRVDQGEIIATAVGYPNNVFVDLGVYDVRGINPFQNFQKNAVCWLDLLEPSISAHLKTLPAGSEGKTSTLCTPIPLEHKKQVNITATFTIITGNITRSFKAEKYHNQSPDVYIEASNPTIVHVTKAGITWDDFFKTLPMKVTRDCLTTGDGETLCDGEEGTLKFYLNDVEDSDILGREIKNGDKALIKFTI